MHQQLWVKSVLTLLSPTAADREEKVGWQLLFTQNLLMVEMSTLELYIFQFNGVIYECQPPFFSSNDFGALTGPCNFNWSKCFLCCWSGSPGSSLHIFYVQHCTLQTSIQLSYSRNNHKFFLAHIAVDQITTTPSSFESFINNLKPRWLQPYILVLQQNL